MSSQQEDAVPIKRPPTWKILVLGDANAGKSSIITRYADRTFNINGYATIGMDFRTRLIAVDEVVYKLQIWDTYGGERWSYRHVSTVYYRGVKAVILVYDITNRASFESLVEKWIMAVRFNTAKSDHKVLLFIVGTKLDLHGQRQVFQEEAEAYARSIGALFCETSARTGENVDLVFEKLTRRLITEGIPPFIYEKGAASNKPKDKSCCLS